MAIEGAIGIVAFAIFCAAAALAYVLPSIIAIAGKHHNAAAIVALNLLAGWTFIGWVVAAVWSLTSGPRRP